MKKFLSIGVFLILTCTGLMSQDWGLRTGIHMTPGLVYNGTWDPGYNGTALVVSASYTSGFFLFEAGAELGADYSGFNTFLSLGSGFRLIDAKPFSVFLTATVLPGIKLNRPSVYFLIAGEAGLRFDFEINPSISLAAYLGPRYTYSPDYSQLVGPHEFLDLTTELSLRFSE